MPLYLSQRVFFHWNAWIEKIADFVLLKVSYFFLKFSISFCWFKLCLMTSLLLNIHNHEVLHSLKNAFFHCWYEYLQIRRILQYSTDWIVNLSHSLGSLIEFDGGHLDRYHANSVNGIFLVDNDYMLSPSTS